MSRRDRIAAEARAATLEFARRRAAVFFTFVFPVLLVVIFGALVRTSTGSGGGLFTEPPAYYVPGYLAVVVLFTPIQRIGGTVARNREGSRFEKLATTPLTRADWLVAHATVNGAVVLLAGLILGALAVVLTGAAVTPSPLVPVFVALGVAVFAGVGAVIGRVTDSHDGAIAAGNAVSLPLLFLSETFVPPGMLPAWLRPWLGLSPLTHFSRGVRAATTGAGDPWLPLAVLAALAAVSFGVGAAVLPWTE